MPDIEAPPLTAADLAGNSGTLPSITWKGKTYEVAYPCPKAIQELERYVKVECYRRLGEFDAEIAEFAGEPSLRQAPMQIKAKLLDQLVNREWAAFEPLYRSVLGSPALRGNQLWACLKIAGNELSHEDVDSLIRAKPDEIKLLMGELDRSFLRLAALYVPGLNVTIPDVKKKEETPPQAI